MFNLEQAFADWRDRMKRAGLDSPDVLDELESHLREETERQILSGASEQEAFESAVARVGRVELLGAEFDKITAKDGWSRFLKASYYFFAIGMLVINAWTLSEYELSLFERFSGLAITASVCLYLIWLPALLKSLTPLRYIQFVQAMKLPTLLVALWPIVLLLHAEHWINLPIGILPSTIIWSILAGVALTSFAIALNQSHRRPGNWDGPLPPSQPQPVPIAPCGPCPPECAAPLGAKPLDDNLQLSFAAAKEEAIRLGHGFIGTEHVLLGLLKCENRPLDSVLRRMKLDRDAVRCEIERLISWPITPKAGPALCLTPRAQKALKLAGREAEALNDVRVNSEHVFLGLLLEGSGIAAMALKKLGIQISKARAEIGAEPRTQKAK